MIKKKNADLTVQNIDNQIEDIRNQLVSLKGDLRSLIYKKAEIELSPFKIGQDVMCELQMGRTKKMCKGVLHVDIGNFGYTIQVQPYKANGELGNRFFNIYARPENPITSQLSEVE